ncbi:MAG: type II secretion system protein [Kiritimatiellia bacterium]|jgi:prepilin-type N-terminal cleavage/methylation domain-containing protein
MKNTKSQSPFAAFTLIELLVVIAIIGILAGLLFPAIQGALVNANALRVGNNGKNIVLAIISVNTEREAMSLGSVWPTKTATFKDGRTPQDYSTGDSETYFGDLIDSKTIDNLGWFVFAGAGVPAAVDLSQFLQGGYNVWNYVGALDESAGDDTPFLFSRNFNIETGDIKTFSTVDTIDNSNPFGEKLDAAIKPFGDALVVMIQKGGALQSIKKRYLVNPKQFFSSSVFGTTSDGTTMNQNATVVKAKTAGG